MLSWQRFAALVLAFTLVAPGLTLAQRRPAPAPAKTNAAPKNVSSADAAGNLPPIKFTEYTLPNGLRVILHEDHSTPIVGVNLWYHVGSKNETQAVRQCVLGELDRRQ